MTINNTVIWVLKLSRRQNSMKSSRADSRVRSWLSARENLIEGSYCLSKLSSAAKKQHF